MLQYLDGHFRAVAFQDFRDLSERDSELAQNHDLSQSRDGVYVISPISEILFLDGGNKSDLLVIAQRSRRDAEAFGYFTDRLQFHRLFSFCFICI